MPFYAVAKGKETGVFQTWSQCQEQIVGFKGAVYKKFPTEEEALQFVQERKSCLIDKRKTTENSAAKPEKDGAAEETDGSKSTKGKKRQLSTEESNDVRKKGKAVVESSNDESKFTVDSDGFLVVYTDGSCEFNGRHGAKAGVGVFFGVSHPMNVSEPVKGRATNNTAEIQAAAYALELTKASGFDKVIVNTDSQFMISCMTSWMPSWKKNDWKKKDGAEVINKEDLMKLDQLTEGLMIKWNFVKAHAGIHGNEAADNLAKEGAKRYKAPE